MKATHLKSFIGPTIFSIAMGFMEAAIVVYLRELYYPHGFDFPIQPVKPMSTSIILVEVVREFCTLVMLVYMGYIHGKTLQERFAYFLFCFAIWDIFYYVFLYLAIDWPASLITWDLLFLIPVPWIGPVWSPVLISLLMILLSVVIVLASKLGYKTRLKPKQWISLILGSLVVILSWTIDYMLFIYEQFDTLNFFAISKVDMNVVNQSYAPNRFPWVLFLIGTLIIVAAIVDYISTNFPSKNLRHAANRSDFSKIKQLGIIVLAVSLFFNTSANAQDIEDSSEMRYEAPKNLKYLTYSISTQELNQIVNEIRETKKHPLWEDFEDSFKRYMYTDAGMGTSELGLPYRKWLKEKLEGVIDSAQFNAWTFVRGKVREVKTTLGRNSYISHRIWYNDLKPILSVSYNKNGAITQQYWISYKNKMPHRIIRLGANTNRIASISLLDYSRLGLTKTSYAFDGNTGKLTGYGFDAHGIRYSLDISTGHLRHSNSGQLANYKEKIQVPWPYRIASHEEYGLGTLSPKPNFEKFRPVNGNQPLRPEHIDRYNYPTPENVVSLGRAAIRNCNNHKSPFQSEQRTVKYSEHHMETHNLTSLFAEDLKNRPPFVKIYYQYVYSDNLIREIYEINDGNKWIMQRFWYNKELQPIVRILYYPNGVIREASYGQYQGENILRILEYYRFGSENPGPLLHSGVWLNDYTGTGNVRNVYHFSGREGKLASVWFDLHGIQFEYFPSSQSFSPWREKLDVPWYMRENKNGKYTLSPGYR